MNKHLIIVIADVKYPSSENTYLTANSYVVQDGNSDDYENSIKDFREHVEVDGFQILSMMIHIPPKEYLINLSDE